MSKNRHKLREDLISMERVNSELHSHYREEMEKMFTEEITGVRKFGLWAGNLLRLLLGLGITFNAVFNYPLAFGAAVRWLWGIGGTAILVISFFGLRVVWRKSLDLRKDLPLMALLKKYGISLVAFYMVGFALFEPDLHVTFFMVIIAILLIVIGTVPVILDRIQQGELNTREKLLEIEYRLAALDERLQGGKGN